MVRLKTDETFSPYYPPRARWYGWLFAPWFGVRRVLHLESIHLPGGISAAQFFLSIVVPGFAFAALGRRLLGLVAFSIYCFTAMIFIAALGYGSGSVAFGLMIAAHATSIVFLEGRWLADARFRVRLAAAVATLLALWGLVYFPLIGFVERHWFTPMRIGDNVVVVWRGATAASVHRGDWVAFEIQGTSAPGIYLQSGLAIDSVLAVAGDRVEFTKQALLVNGKPLPRAAHMPAAGGFVVAEKTWFIWLRLDINRRGGVPEADVSAAMQQVAMVSEEQFIGKPFKHWFGRRQILEQ